MRTILIPCSGRKREGGGAGGVLSGSVRMLLSPESSNKLLFARADLCRSLNLVLGPYLGLKVGGEILYMAAYERYDG